MTFSGKYILVTEKVVEKLKAEAVPGSGLLLDGVINPDHIFWGSPVKEKRDVWEGDRCIYVLPGNTALYANTVGSYSVPELVHCMVWGMYDDLDQSLLETLKVAGLIVDVFTKKDNEDLDNNIRVIHNPEGGPDFELFPGFQPADIKNQAQYYQWVEVVFYCHFIQPIEP